MSSFRYLGFIIADKTLLGWHRLPRYTAKSRSSLAANSTENVYKTCVITFEIHCLHLGPSPGKICHYAWESSIICCQIGYKALVKWLRLPQEGAEESSTISLPKLMCCHCSWSLPYSTCLRSPSASFHHANLLLCYNLLWRLVFFFFCCFIPLCREQSRPRHLWLIKIKYLLIFSSYALARTITYTVSLVMLSH